jgi:hypothetical protein
MTLREEDGIRGLIGFSLRSLRRMQLDNGLFCEEVVAGEPGPRGLNLRYSLMTFLGLVNAEAGGHSHGFDLGGIHAELLARLDAPQLRPGDFGLHLWADAFAAHDRHPALLERLRASLAADGGLARREGMEVAWIVQGLAHQVAEGANGAARDDLGLAVDHLLARQHPRSGLFRHVGDGSPRRRFPNFATQIYAVLALATVTKLGVIGGERPATAARRAADRLLSLQLDDGGWPWLYDADSGRVVERYEVYTVHQDAMAPMALLQLAEATGERGYADAALHGLRWIYGRNELGSSMVDPEAEILYRSIRRQRPWDRLMLYANTAASTLTGAGRVATATGPLELNRTDRPYHLGWVLEAWCGREDVQAAA